MKVTIDKRFLRANIDFSLQHIKEKKFYIIACEELKISSHGDNLGEAFDSFKEIFELYFETLLDENIKISGRK